ncbi:MAG TPA: ATP-binding protein [Nitrososphaeraceae archaeon]|nr:ATP-binding protein [Nitrososphaeraceae archaeon]
MPPAEGKIEIVLEKINDTKNDNKRDFVSVKIKDNRKGIDNEILSHLFEKFVSKAEFGGIGLGLYISKNIVEYHGGKNNDDGIGAEFGFTLPK